MPGNAQKKINVDPSGRISQRLFRCLQRLCDNEESMRRSSHPKGNEKNSSAKWPACLRQYQEFKSNFLDVGITCSGSNFCNL
jgi:hypothetical protein